MSLSPWRFCVAPMLDWSDRHCRYFWRGLTQHARLYTEMVTTGAILHGDRERFLRFDAAEHPVALQLGGSDADALARCAEIGEQFGYDEINLNCGCPSDRVQGGGFGACLMNEPQTAAAAVRAMRGATALPVTVKHRIGVDDSDEYDFMRRFVETVADAGCEVFIIHARKAWLKGLSPKENREIPPLRYEAVHRLKQEFPRLTVVLNGGVRGIDACETHLAQIDGVMLGREVYENPYMLAGVDARLFGDAHTVPSRDEVLARMQDYAARQLAGGGTALNHITRHILGLYRNQPGGRAFRRVLSERATKPGSDATLLAAAREAMDALPSPAAA
ncbi:MAG: tRNA dihydrouridine(20/20a) synthase DusA [Solimonas sp.]